MRVIRPVKFNDLESVKYFAEESGIGMTHLPNNEQLLRKKLQISLDSFANLGTLQKTGDYLFVLADSNSDEPDGTCGVTASVGIMKPLHVFSIDTMALLSERIKPPSDNRLLKLKAYQNGPSEIGSLFLLPELRSGGWGKLLSWSRFLFMATFPAYFKSVTIANMRGLMEKNVSVFWDGLGRHFLDMDFSEMMQLRMNNQILGSEIFPDFPLPVALLSPETQQAIGAVYPQSRAALTLLLEEGFCMVNEIDPYDGGSIIRANTADIRAIKTSSSAILSKIELAKEESSQFIICNTRTDFRACYGSVKVLSDDNIMLAHDVALALKVDLGDRVRYLKI